MIDQAIEKIKKETEEGKSNKKIIADYITGQLITSEAVAEKIMAPDKSLIKCMEFIMKKAKERASDNMAMIEETEVYSWVREYFGVSEEKNNVLSINLLDLMD